MRTKLENLELPSQEVLLKTNLRPGRNVDLVVFTDLEKDIIDTRSTTIHDITEKGLVVLAQPTRPLGPSAKGSLVEVTFLGRYHDVPGGRWLRVGYRTTVLGVLQDYDIGQNRRESVIVVRTPQELTQHTLRLHYRLEPPADVELYLYLEPDHELVPIVDISQGGVRFAHSPSWSYSRGFAMRFTLVSGRLKLPLKGKVVASYEGGPTGKLKQNHTAVQFIDLDKEIAAKLGELLNRLSRRELAKRSGVLEQPAD